MARDLPKPAPARGRGPRIPGSFDLKIGKDGPRIIGRDPISQAVESQRPDQKAAAAKARAEVLRRQRLLKSLDYKIVVDGIWGPRSQTAWNDYEKRRKAGKTLALGGGPLKPEKGVGLNVNERDGKLQAVPGDPIAPYRLRVDEAEAQAAKERKAYRDDVLKRAELLRGQIGSGRVDVYRKTTLHQIAAVVLDPEVNLGVYTPKGATLFQEWAVANHIEKIKVTGRYDIQTHGVLKRLLDQAEKRERRQRVQAISTRLYGPAGVKPGDKVSWLPYAGIVPTADELDKIVQGETTGFQAATMLSAFLKRAESGDAVFDAWRRAQLLTTAASLQPFGKGAQPKWLINSGSTGGNMLQVYMELLGTQHMLAPIGDFTNWEQIARIQGNGNDSPEVVRQKAIDAAMSNEKWRSDNAKYVGELHAQVTALAHATNAEDFTAKLAANVATAERNWEAFQKSLAGENGSWWGAAIDMALAPGNYVRTVLVNEAMNVWDNPTSFFLLKDKPERQQRWEDAQAFLGYAPEDYSGTQKKGSAWFRVPFELAVDPLNFAHPFRLGSTALRYGNLSRTAGRYVFTPDASRGLLYEKGTWSKLAGLQRVDRVLNGSLALHLDPTLNKWVDNATRATQTRTLALAAARNRVSLYAANSFRTAKPPSLTAKGMIEDFDIRSPKNTKTLNLLSKGELGTRKWLTGDKDQKLILNTLSLEKQSLWVNFDRTRGLSNVGAAYRANLIEKLRIQSIHRVATSEAYRVYSELLDAAPHGNQALPRAVREDFSKRAYAQYHSIVHGSGAFLKGGFLSKGGSADKDLMLRIEHDLAGLIAQVDDTIMPVMQNLLEEAAEREGFSLWDEGGRWANRHGGAARTVRALGRESFKEGEKLVDNTQFGIKYSHGEAIELIEAEVQRRTGRVLQFQARQIGADMATDFDVDAKIALERLDVENAWDHEGSEWFDTREKVGVSDLYIRHLEEAYETDEAGDMFYRGRAKSPTGSMTWADRLKALADAPANVAGSEADDAGWQLAWYMTGGYTQNLPGRVRPHPTRRFDGPDMSGLTKPEAVELEDADILYGNDLQNALLDHGDGVARASNELLSGELRKQLALWAALAHSQTWYTKAIYLGLAGVLNTWTFATLALRPGWMVRNVIDNTAKLIVQGVHDPRYYFLGGKNPGAMVGSIFDLGLTHIRQSILFLDNLFGTIGTEQWLKLEATIWSHSAETLQKIFKAHGVDAPEDAFEAARLTPFEQEKVLRETGVKGRVSQFGEGVKDVASSFREHAFELMGNRPENYFRRILYRAETDKFMERELAKGRADDAALALDAHNEAWRVVEKTLFDYSKVTVIEDNFRVFFPFIQFWRKNTTFWTESFVNKPWLPLSVVKLDDERREQHKDLPGWMRRYVHVDEITDATAMIPGVSETLARLLPEDTQYDPFNLMSFSPFYRSIPKILDELGAQVGLEKGLEDRLKTENPNLPGEKEGWKIVGPFLDMLGDWGLGASPFARKPAESAGIATERSWQFMFPQTGPAVALTRQFWGDSAALKVAGWESFWGLLPLGVSSDAIADNFEYYVQQEVANQASRGQTLDVEEARKVVRLWFLTKEVFAYGTGMYLRRATPEDMYLAKLAEADYKDIPADQQTALALWRKRGYDRLSFERYVAMVPLIQAYYASGDDWQRKVELKNKYPELTQYVDATWRGKPYSGKWTVNAQRYMQEGKFFQALDITKALDAPFDVQGAALTIFKTPGMEAHWKENDTPADQRRDLIRAAAFEYYTDLTNDYHEIREDDFEAKRGFLAEHPELIRHWNENNDAADDYDAIIGGANAALREMYFGIVKKHTVPGKHGESAGFRAAAQFLKDFRFMFEDTKSASKIDMETGTWKSGGGGKFSPERLAAFLAAKPHLTWFFDVFMKSVGQKKAWAWLETSDSAAAEAIKAYLSKYGKRSAKSIAYLRARPWLKLYFDLPEDERGKWLDGGSEGARIVKDYFDKYAHPKGNTQHAKDFLATKRQREYYFSLPKAQRKAWLEAGSPDALVVLDYFKKYSKTARLERKFLKAFPQLTGGTPEQQQRLEFWRQFFELTPDMRPAFVHGHAEEFGVFLYGEFGEQEQHDREAEYFRRAVGLGLSKRQSMYLYAKPLLDFYYKLPKEERALFSRLNPELEKYLNDYADGVVTGDKKLDAAIEQYFKLPTGSIARSAWLRTHPEVQAWFNSKASPAEKAMRTVLDQYFRLPAGVERDEFLAQHPEIPVYFERRRAEKSLQGDIFDAFDESDPRLRDYFKSGDDLLRAAEEMRRKLRVQALNKFTPDSVESRRDRQPASLQ